MTKYYCDVCEEFMEDTQACSSERIYSLNKSPFKHLCQPCRRIENDIDTTQILKQEILRQKSLNEPNYVQEVFQGVSSDEPSNTSCEPEPEPYLGEDEDETVYRRAYRPKKRGTL